MISFTNKISGMDKLAAKLRGWPKVRQEAVKAMSKEALKLVDEGWQNQADPEGNAWRPKKVPDGNPTLVGKTKRLRKSFKAHAGSAGFTLQSNNPYAGFHQSGTSRMVARRMLPSRRGMPASWRARMHEVALRVILKRLG